MLWLQIYISKVLRQTRNPWSGNYSSKLDHLSTNATQHSITVTNHRAFRTDLFQFIIKQLEDCCLDKKRNVKASSWGHHIYFSLAFSTFCKHINQYLYYYQFHPWSRDSWQRVISATSRRKFKWKTKMSDWIVKSTSFLIQRSTLWLNKCCRKWNISVIGEPVKCRNGN